MDIWPFNIRKKTEETKNTPFIADVYIRNELNMLRVEEVANLAICLAKEPNWNYGVKIPEGNFISKSHYERLPENLKKFFDKTTMTFERL